MQGNCSDFSHWGSQRYAYDFDMSIGTNITAIRSGTVVSVEESFEDGSPCPDNNYIEIEHSDGSIASYLHLTKDGALFDKGDDVDKGDVIAESGNTGCSTDPHLHLIVFEDDSQTNSIPISFQNTSSNSRGLKEGKSYKAKD